MTHATSESSEIVRIGGLWRPVAMLALSLMVSMECRAQGAGSTAESRPAVDPGLVGTWWHAYHFVVLFTYEVHPSGILRESIRAMGSGREPSRVYLLRAADGKLTKDDLDGRLTTATYEIKLADQLADRIVWSNPGAYPMRMERTDDLRCEDVAASRPASRAPLTRADVDDVSELVALSKSTDVGHRELAIYRLGIIAARRPADAEAALPVLIVGLSDSVAIVREIALERILDLGLSASRVIPMLIPALKDKDPALRVKAAELLGQLGTDSAVIPALAERLDDEYEVRMAAVRAIVRFGKAGAVALGVAANSPCSRVSTTALETLSDLGPDAAPAVPGLITLIRTGNDDERKTFAISIIGIIGPPAKEAVPSLVAALDGGRSVATSAALALSRFPDDAPKSVPAIVKLLEKRPWTSSPRIRLIEAIGDFGSRAASALPTLDRIIADQGEREDLRAAARAARDRIAPK